MPKAGFYGVRVGREIGVYSSWEECKNQTEGYPNARYRRFTTQKAAEDFAHGTIISTPLLSKSDRSAAKGKKRTHAKIEDDSCWDVVYSDGACKGNGKDGSVAGFGVWWGHEDPRNIAERCPGDQTNNKAELMAILSVLETTPLSKRPLLIKTDSEYSINCFDKWISNWMKKGWKTSNGEPVKNEGIIRCISSLLEIRSRSGQKVRLQHVKGHSGEIGNEGADCLATEGTLKSPVEEPDWKALNALLVKVLEGSVDPGESSLHVKSWKSGEVEVPSRRQSDRAATPDPTAFSLPGKAAIPPSRTRIVQDRLGRLDKLSSGPSRSTTELQTADETEVRVTSMLMPSSPLVRNATKIIPVLEPQNTGVTAPLDSNVSPPRLTGQTVYACPSTESPVRVLYAAPPLVPVPFEDVDFEDYSDCLVDDADLALELSD